METSIIILFYLSSLNSSITASGQLNQITIEYVGDRVLTGKDTAEISSMSYVQNGKIIIRDNATLRIADTQLKFSNETRIELYGDARIIITHSVLNLTGTYDAINAFDRSQVIIVDSQIINQFWCPVHQVYHYYDSINLHNETRLEADKSSIAYLRSFDRSLSDISSSFVGSLLINEKSSACVRISNSSLYTFSPSSGICDVEGSAISYLAFNLENGSYQCRLSLGKNVVMWNTKRDGSGIPCDLTLHNTRLLEFVIYITNSTLDIRDSNPSSLTINGHSNISITNCSTNVYFHTSTVETMKIAESHIGRLDGFDVNIQELFFNKSVIGFFGIYATIKELYIEESTINKAEFGLGEYTRVDRAEVGAWWSGAYWWNGSIRLVEVSDSSFGNFTINTQSAYSFRNVTIRDQFGVLYSDSIEPSYISGDVIFQNKGQVYDFDINSDAYYRVTREYYALVTRGGAPLPQAYMELQSGNETLWKGESDFEGKARFNVTYSRTYIVNPIPGQQPLVNEGNMTRHLILYVKDRGDAVTIDLSLFSDTPLEARFSSIYPSYQLQLFAVFIFLLLIIVVVSILSRLRART